VTVWILWRLVMAAKKKKYTRKKGNPAGWPDNLVVQIFARQRNSHSLKRSQARSQHHLVGNGDNRSEQTVDTLSYIDGIRR